MSVLEHKKRKSEKEMETKAKEFKRRHCYREETVNKPEENVSCHLAEPASRDDSDVLIRCIMKATTVFPQNISSTCTGMFMLQNSFTDLWNKLKAFLRHINFYL